MEDMKFSAEGGFCFFLSLEIEVCNQREERRVPSLGKALSFLRKTWLRTGRPRAHLVPESMNLMCLDGVICQMRAPS